MTKRVESKVVKKENTKQTAIFLYEDIIICFGYSKILMSDNGIHFLNEAIEKWPHYLSSIIERLFPIIFE